LFSAARSKATDVAKQELFARLAEHFLVLASEVEKAIAKIATKELGRRLWMAYFAFSDVQLLLPHLHSNM
jgi:hypothetical protein